VTDARRSPRLRVRAPAELRYRGARHDAIAEDVCAEGCRLASPVPLRRGEALYVTLYLRGVAAPLSASATVVWSTPEAPHHVGVAFGRDGGAERVRRMRELVAGDPALARTPAPLRPAQRLRLGAPPPPGAVLGRDELFAARAARDASTALQLLDAAGPRFREVRAALETLRAHGLVHEGPARPAAPAWAELLGEREPAPARAEARVAHPFAPAPRPPVALACADAARAEAASGHRGAAVEWLQAGLAAAPGDAELSAALEELTGA
jgi:hypothetical protein